MSDLEKRVGPALDGLDGVPWEYLEHNYGSAADVPALLRGLVDSANTDPDLRNLLHHQGGWVCSAATAALPFLVELASSVDVVGRLEALEIVGALAGTSTEAEPKWVHQGWPGAWQRVLPDVLALTGDADPEVRRSALYVVGCGGGPADLVVPALLSRWNAEQDFLTRLDIVLTAGEFSADERVVAWLRGLPVDEPQQRMAVTYALREVDQPRAQDVVPALRGDLSLWRESAWLGCGPQGVIRWASELFAQRPVDHTAFLLAVSGPHEDAEQRIGELREVGRLLTKWRSPTEAVLPMIASRLTDPAAEARWQAVVLLGSARAVRYADEVAALVHDDVTVNRQQQTVGDAAVWALSRFGRVVPELATRLPRFGSGTRLHQPDLYAAFLPGEHEVLEPLKAHARELTPAVLKLVGESGGFRRRDLVRVLGTWRANEALSELERLAPDDPVAAWAWWRCGGDAEEAAAIIARDLTHDNVALLGDLGPAAVRHVDSLPMDDGHDWMRVRTRLAFWRMTGEPRDLVPVCTELVDGLDQGRYLPVMREALRGLVGAGERLEVLRPVRASDQRICYFGGWRAFVEDETVRALLEDMFREPENVCGG